MENTYSLDISDDSITLELQTGKSNFAVNVVLAIAILAFLIPVAVLLFIVGLGGGFSFGFLFTLVLFWGTGVFLLRLGLWNKYGREVFIFSKRLFIHYNDYKYFKDNYKETECTQIEVAEAFYIDEENNNSEEATFLVLLDGDETLYSRKKIPVSLIKEINEKVIKLNKIY